MSSDTEQESQHQQPYRPELGSPRRPVPVEHHLWLHSIESSALAAFGLILIAAVLPHAVPLWFIATTGATLAAVLWFVSLTVTGSLGMAGYLLAWGIVAAGWLTAERVAGLWRAEVLAGLILPTLILAPLGAVAIGHYRDRGTRDARTEDKDRADAAIREWQNRFRRVGADRVTVLEVIKNPGGVQVHGRLPRAVAGKITLTMDMIKNLETSIATDMRLAKGAVQIGEGATSADFVVNARTKKGKRETVFLPAENLPQTVNRPFGLGLYDNGKPFQLLYREVAVIIIGVRGSGKSNLINVFLAQLARCIDASVFMIDLKGGRAARPWMMPWVRGHTRRPVVDWLATTREEAVLMLDALLRAGDARARGAAGGWEKLEPTFEMPAIILVVDETAVMTGHNIRDDGISNTAIAQKLAQLTETYRSEAIDPLVAALRGNVDIMGSTAVKAMSEVRIGLRVTQASDGQSVFPDDYNAAKALSTITDEGAGLAKVGATVSPVIHFYRMTEERITAIATWAGNETTPDLETRVQEAMGPAYATRWERDHGMKLKSEWREQAGMPEPLPVNDEFEKIIGQIDDPEKQVDPRHKKMREVVRQSGFKGLTVARITRRLADAGMTTPRETVHRWLVKDEEDGYVRRSGPPHNLWHWVTPEPLDSLPGMQPDELAGDDDDED